MFTDPHSIVTEEIPADSLLVDGDHRTIFAMLAELGNRLIRLAEPHAAGNGQKLDTGADVLDALSGLRDYARHYFDVQERRMHEAGFEEYNRHRRLHNEFIAELNMQRRLLEQGVMAHHAAATLSAEHAADLVRYLTSWLTTHIEVEDRRFFAQQHAYVHAAPARPLTVPA